MAFGSVRLVPGLNVERSPTLLEAGYSTSQLIRFKDGLAQKLGGWTQYYVGTVAGIPRAMHAWQDLDLNDHLAVGTTTNLDVITSGSLSDVTPTTTTTTPAIDVSTVINTPTVTIIDLSIGTLSTFDSVYFNVPISIGGLILSGLYPIAAVGGATTYSITADKNATATVNNAGAGPSFTTVNNDSTVTVTLNDHGTVAGDRVIFPLSTTGNGVTIMGHYKVITVVNANNFTIITSNQASAAGTFSMAGGTAGYTYYINIGPPAAGTGYGFGGYGSGLYGGGAAGTVQTGTPITATDWTFDNWGEILLACPTGGGIYQYDPTGGFLNAGLVGTAPAYNGGMFVSTQQQILVTWASTQTEAIGVVQDPMLVQWSASGDYTDFTVSDVTQAGNFRIPFGSTIMGGCAAMNQNLIWTDLDLWVMNYLGPPLVYGFNMIGADAGLISAHAAMKARGAVYWMGRSNFYQHTQAGVHTIQCPVWDSVFQNLNTAYSSNIRSMCNTPFNEVGWLFPSSASSSGECDSYVKFNTAEPDQPWDIGLLPRSAWIDQTLLGPPIAATSAGVIYQHEETPDAAGGPLASSFTTGFFEIGEGEDFAFVDQIIPDMKWALYSGGQSASVQLTFNVVDHPGDTPRTYGPFTMTSTQQYITTRIRGRQMSVTLASNDVGSWWRIGRIRYRWRPDGRR
jgi:hypothetical protein